MSEPTGGRWQWERGTRAGTWKQRSGEAHEASCSSTRSAITTTCQSRRKEGQAEAGA